MKPAQTLVESLGTMSAVTKTGDIRQIIANSLLALARKEIPASDLEAMAKGLDSISNSMNTEIKVAKTQMEMREKAGTLGKGTDIEGLGSMGIGMPDKTQ